MRNRPMCGPMGPYWLFHLCSTPGEHRHLSQILFSRTRQGALQFFVELILWFDRDMLLVHVLVSKAGNFNWNGNI